MKPVVYNHETKEDLLSDEEDDCLQQAKMMVINDTCLPVTIHHEYSDESGLVGLIYKCGADEKYRMGERYRIHDMWGDWFDKLF